MYLARILLLASLLLSSAGVLAEVEKVKPVLLASIKPIAMLISTVVGDQAEVKVLLPPYASPHDYALKFSDLRAIKQADLLVWVGPELEGMLAKSFDNESKAKQLSLAQLDTLFWPGEQSKNSGNKIGLQSHQQNYDHSHQQGHGHNNEYFRDPHIWLNPNNGVVIARAITEWLGSKYPEKKFEFERNLELFSAQMIVLDKLIREQTDEVKAKGFIVMHDGYRHFVDYYGMKQLATVKQSHGVDQGIKRYAGIIALGDQVDCVFVEPQFNSKSAIQIANKLGASYATLDIMGGQVKLGRNSYQEFMVGFVQTLVGCLKGEQQTEFNQVMDNNL